MSEHFVNCSVESKVTVTLEISHSSAKWLKANMQNPLHLEDISKETDEDNYYRSLFWEALEDV